MCKPVSLFSATAEMQYTYIISNPTIYIVFFSVYIDLTVVMFFCFPVSIRLAYLRVRSNIVTALYKKE